MLNIAQLRQDLETFISAANANTATDDVMLITAALDNITEDRIVSLNLVNDLPEAYNVASGTIFFVKEINTLVFASVQNKWKGLDGRVLRLDPVIAIAFGFNGNGRLGDNTGVQKSSPITVVGGITNWSFISAGLSHSLGIANNVTYAWGNGVRGKLGNNSTLNQSSPVTVVGGITNWTQVSAGPGHSIGIADGIAYAWGSNASGRLGDGTVTDRSSPVIVVGSITNWSQVSAGGVHSIGIAKGIAYAWGGNSDGRLGDETTVTRSSPATVVGGITNWSQVSAGEQFNIGISNGIAYAWGSNSNGQLGDSTVINRSSPVTVTGGIVNWAQISSGTFQNIGVTMDGIAYAWGLNTTGRLGDGTTINKSSPVTVVGGITNWSQVSASSYHSLGLTADGIAYAWGNNLNGQHGDNTTSPKSSPVTVAGNITNWSQVSAGGVHSIALKTD